MLLNKVLTSISDTYNFTGKPSVIFLNTSDVLNGKFLHNDFTETELLPGQAKKSIKFNDLLYSEIRPVNRHFALVKVNDCDNYVVSTKLMVLRLINSNYSMDYIYQFLSSLRVIDDLQTMAESRSGTFPQITFTELGSIEIPNISLTEQQHIVNILGSIDDKIENNEKMIKQFETLNRLYFHKNYILADKKDWKIELLGNCVDITRGSSPRPIQDYLGNKGMPWVKISDATENDSNYLTKTKEFIKEDGINLSKTVIPNTLIVSNSATPGLPKIMKITACVHDGWLIFTNYKDLTKEFVKYVIDFNKKELISSGNGSVFTNLKTEILKALKIYLPPKNILEQMNNYLKANLDIQYKLECNNIKLQELKQLYLKKFFG